MSIQHGLLTVVMGFTPVQKERYVPIGKHQSNAKVYAMRKLSLTIAILAAFIQPATAIDLSQPIKNIDGTDIVNAEGKPLGLTLSIAIINSLLNETGLNEVEKGKNYQLAVTITTNTKDWLPTAEDIVRIKKAAGAIQPTLVYGQIVAALDTAFTASLPKK